MKLGSGHFNEAKFLDLPKKGRRKATQTVEKTNPVLREMKHKKLVDTLTGSSSSMLLANGFINRANLFIVKEREKKKSIK